MVRIYPLPEGEAPSSDFAITIDGQPAEAYQCRVSAVPYNTVWPGRQRPIDQTELASFIYFGIGEEGAALRVTAKRPFGEAVVRPLSKSVGLARDGDAVCFTITQPGQYTLELDGYHNALHIFADAVKPEADADKHGPDVLYFGPGVHRPGPIKLESNQTLYIDAGAVVHTSITAREKRNIRILGHGVIDNSTFDRVTGQHTSAPLRCYDCENVEVRGVIFRDASAWTATMYRCDNIVFDNVKLIGMWRYNSDGIDLVNSRNALITRCFLRNFDDCVVLKGLPPYRDRNVENIVVSGCVIWCDWGRGLELGAETFAPEYRNILFTDCDLIHSAHMAMDIQHSGTAYIHDVVFDNIRVEYPKQCDTPVYQHNMDEDYVPTPGTHLPYAMYAEVHDYFLKYFKVDERCGRTRAIVFRDIRLLHEGLPVPPSAFSGISDASGTRDIRIESFYSNGKRAASLEEANVTVDEFAGNVTLE